MTRKRHHTPRGPDGSVRGLVGAVADEVLTRVVWRLAKDGPTFKMATANALFQEMGVTEPRILEGFRFALQGMPGVRKGSRRGEFILPRYAVAHAQHRSWRLALGRANLADAIALQNALRRAPERSLTPGLRRLLGRLSAATLPLLKEEEP